MDSFGFKNFRKFEDFPMMELGGINIFVGKNNSGKSTAIKVLNTIADNFANTTSYYGEQPDGILEPPIHYSSFKLSSASDYLDINNPTIPYMEFSFRVGETNVIVRLFKKSANGDAAKRVLIINRGQISYQYDLQESKVRCSITIDDIESRKSLISSLEKQLENIEKQMSDLNHENVTRQLERTKKAWEQRYEAIKASINHVDLKTNIVEIDLPLRLRQPEITTTNVYLKELLSPVNTLIKNDLLEITATTNISAHGITRDRFISLKNQDDVFAQLISHNSLISGKSGQPNPWLKHFEIGDDLEVKDITNLGEIFTIDVIRGEKHIPVSNMGTGAIQLIQLLMFNPVYMNNNEYRNILIIEEPEQNLHPALQSKLADYFYNFYLESYYNSETHERSEWPVKLIIETHSEYLIRRLQVIAATLMKSGERTLEEINRDFKVYYFPENGSPYSMGFHKDGRFTRPFGTGFVDEAGKHYLQLLDMQ